MVSFGDLERAETLVATETQRLVLVEHQPHHLVLQLLPTLLIIQQGLLDEGGLFA